MVLGVHLSSPKFAAPLGGEMGMARMSAALWVLLLTVSVAAAQDSVPTPLALVPTGTQVQTPDGPARNPEVAKNFTSPLIADLYIPPPPVVANPAPVGPIQAGVRPDPLLPYQPLSPRDKFNIVLRRSYAPDTLASAVFDTTMAQASGQWFQYGGGMQGWGQRLGAILANTESRRFIQGFVLSAALHQDPRYFACPQDRLIARMWYAATRLLVTRSDSGAETFNSSEVLGALFTSSLQNAYFPRPDRGLDDMLGRFTGSLISDATSNLIREFKPDIQRLFRKHEPERIKQIEARFPKPLQQLTGQ